MGSMNFNKNAGRPERASRRSDGYEEIFEDISSFSENYVEDEYEDISSGRDMFADDYEDISSFSGENGRGKKSRGNVPVERVQRRPRKKKKRRKIMKGIFACLLICICALGIFVYGMMGKLNQKDDTHVNQYISDDQLYSDKNVMNILLLGVDAREGEDASRSDTMMLISLDKTYQKIKLTSFLRDSYVEIPGSGWNKLNASCSQGGVNLVRDTIEYNYKIKIDNYMMVDFKAFEELIDALGGVDVEVTEKEASYLNRTWFRWSLTGNELHFDSGEAVHLDGEQALMFCRIRKLDSDFYRTERQRRTISAVKQELMNTNPTEIMSIANNVLPLIETDISSTKMSKLCLEAVTRYLKYDMASQSIPADGTWHSERLACGDSLVFDIDENAEIIHNYIYNDVYEGKENTTVAQ